MSPKSHLHPLCADENFPLPAVRELRLLDYDVLTVQEDGKAGQRYPDRHVLEDAAALGRAVVTLNRKDFRRLHDQGEIRHAGIVLCTQDLDYKRLAANIQRALSNKENLEGEVVNVHRKTTTS